MKIHMHRFGNKVAFSLIPHDGGTVYLTDDEAEEFSIVLAAYARNIRLCEFTESEIGNAEIDIFSGGSK